MNMIKHLAPECSFPGCNKKVSYKNKTYTDKHRLSFNWHTLCSRHRNAGREAVNKWKLKTGCQDSTCDCKIRGPEELTIDHIDGNKFNSKNGNIQILCSNADKRKTKQNADYLKRYDNEPTAYKKFY